MVLNFVQIQILKFYLMPGKNGVKMFLQKLMECMPSVFMTKKK